MFLSETSPHFRRPLVEWLFVCLILLALGGFVAYTLLQEYNRVDAQEKEQLAHQAGVVAVNIGSQLNSINLALSGVVGEMPTWRKQKDGSKLATQHLKALADAMPSVITLFILDAEGTVLASDKQNLIGKNFAQREYFQTVLRHPEPRTLYVSAPFMTTLGNFTMNMARMVPGPDGRFGGIVVAGLDPGEFKILLDSVLYWSDMRASLIHGDGTPFMMAPNKNSVGGLDLVKPGSFFTQHMASGQIANVITGTVNAIDDERMIALQTIQPPALAMDKPLVIAVERGLPAIFAHWRRAALRDCGMFGAVALLAILGLVFHQRRRSP